MNTYRIHSTVTGLHLGDYEAESQEAALGALARDAGYRDHAHACEVTGTPDISVEDITDPDEDPSAWLG